LALPGVRAVRAQGVVVVVVVVVVIVLRLIWSAQVVRVL
jgi:hypothetical protein